MRFPFLKAVATVFSVGGVVIVILTVYASGLAYQLATANLAFEGSAVVIALGVLVFGLSGAATYLAIGSATDVFLAVEESTRRAAETSTLILQRLEEFGPVSEFENRLRALNVPGTQDASPSLVKPGQQQQSTCVKCGGINEEEDDFCRVCGAPLKATCLGCGGVVLAGDKFCRTCGAFLPTRDTAAYKDNEQVDGRRSAAP